MLAMTVHADPINQATAASKAKAFFANRKAQHIAEPRMALQGRQRMLGKGAKATNSYYYVFNNGDNDGFVIVSGDDCTAPILGYADSGSFDASNMPENMRNWLNGYAEEIEWVRTQAKAPGNEAPTPARQVVAPLISTKWTQSNPFNQKCFTADGDQAVTGCVATALAQIMYYHKWPRSSTTAIPNYTIEFNDGTSDSYDGLPATTFDWDNMLLTYSGNETADDPHAIAIANLLFYCGHAVQMDYGVDASSANDEMCSAALVDYFGYGNTPRRLSRGSYSSTEWEELLYNELRHGRPVIYSGKSTGGGHAFICDGYDGNGFYHINWGWAGLSDGYFLLQALNPAEQSIGGSSSSSGYTYLQAMTVGISPTALDDNPQGGSTTSNGQVVVKSIGIESGTSTTFDYSGSAFNNISVNYSFAVTVPGTYSFGFGLYQGDQRLQESSFYTANITSSYDMTFSGLSLWGIGNRLSDGTYTIKCINKPDGATEWQKNIDADCRYIKVTIADGKATLENIVESPQIEVTSVEQRFDAGERKQIRAYLSNNAGSNYSGYFYLAVNDTIRSKEYVYIDGNSESFVNFVFYYSNMAPVNLKIILASTSAILYQKDSFRFTTQSTSGIQPEVLAYEVRNLDNTNKKMYGFDAVATVKLKNTSKANYTGDVGLRVYHILKHNDNGGVSYGWRDNSTSVTLLPSETKEVTVQIPGYSAGQEIWFDITCAGQSYTIGGAFNNYVVTAGYTEWDGNGKATAKALGSSVTISKDAAAVSFQGLSLSGVSITPNSNPNTLYYLDGNITTPGTLSGKNVVKGSMAAGNVTWQEGYPYYVPADFDVSGTISYVRTASTACDGNKGWQTATLPFAVQQVTADGTAIDWNRAKTDDGKDFWVRRYVSVTGDEAYFANTDEWVPNEPYLIGFPAKLTGKKIKWSATATKVLKSGTSAMQGSGYQLVGTGGDREVENAYVLNESGDAFVRSTTATVKAGTAYFIAIEATDNDILRLGSAGLLGDVNDDGKLSVTDVMLLVKYVIGSDPGTINLNNADVNSDNNITVTDVMLLINMIINKN